jgi:hypothetical protein
VTTWKKEEKGEEKERNLRAQCIGDNVWKIDRIRLAHTIPGYDPKACEYHKSWVQKARHSEYGSRFLSPESRSTSYLLLYLFPLVELAQTPEHRLSKLQGVVGLPRSSAHPRHIQHVLLSETGLLATCYWKMWKIRREHQIYRWGSWYCWGYSRWGNRNLCCVSMWGMGELHGTLRRSCNSGAGFVLFAWTVTSWMCGQKSHKAGTIHWQRTSWIWAATAWLFFCLLTQQKAFQQTFVTVIKHFHNVSPKRKIATLKNSKLLPGFHNFITKRRHLKEPPILYR